MVSKGFPNVTTSGRQYNFEEKPSVILYTYINLHAGTPKPQSFLSKSPRLQCSIGSERELFCLHIKSHSGLYSVLSDIRTGPTDADTFRGHRLTTQKGYTYQKEIKGPRKLNTHAIIGK